MLFLHRKGWLKDFINRMIVRQGDPTGEITLQEICSKDTPTLIAEWKAWVRSQPIDKNVRLVKRAFVKTHPDWKAWRKANQKKVYWNEQLGIYEAK